MAQKFLLTLMSSWLVNPLGVLIAQWFGVANSPEIMLVLLLVGTATPFQFLMNECLAAGVASKRAVPSWLQLAAIMLIQLTTCILAVINIEVRSFDIQWVYLIAIALCFNTLNSYVISVIFFGLVVNSNISRNGAMIIGALPGIASIALFSIYSFSSFYLLFAKPWIALAISCFPGIVQLVYLIHLKNASTISPENTQHYLHVVGSPHLFLSLAILATLAILSTNFREHLASFSTSYGAILLVALNLVFSLTNTLTRVSFFSTKKMSNTALLAAITGVGVVFTVTAYLFNWSLMQLFCFVTLQAAAACTISACRSLSVTSKKMRLPYLFS
jgi:hypothetical protein